MKYIISESLNSGFFFSIFYFEISKLCNSEVLFSSNVPPTPYRSPKTFFWNKLGSNNKNIHLQDFKDAFLKYRF